jgi:hypothetical protein
VPLEPSIAAIRGLCLGGAFLEPPAVAMCVRVSGVVFCLSNGEAHSDLRCTCRVWVGFAFRHVLVLFPHTHVLFPHTHMLLLLPPEW